MHSSANVKLHGRNPATARARACEAHSSCASHSIRIRRPTPGPTMDRTTRDKHRTTWNIDLPGTRQNSKTIRKSKATAPLA
eukprot:3822447-Pyramimonas_sp.AAC.1